MSNSPCEHTIAEWAEICGVKVGDTVVLSDGFTKHGKKAVADIHVNSWR